MLCVICLCSLVVALAERLTAFNARTAQGGPPHTAIQVQAGCLAYMSCASIAASLQLGSADIFRCTAAAVVVLEAGTRVLADAASLGATSVGVASVGAASSSGEHQPASQGVPRPHALLAEHQLFAISVSICDLLRPSLRPREAAAFARTTGKPSAVLPWLERASKVLLASPCAEEEGEG